MRQTVAVLSHFSLENYGNRLQSAAVVSLLHSYGLAPMVIAPCGNVLTRACKVGAQRMLPIHSRSERERLGRFVRFSRQHAKFRYVARRRLDDVLASYDMAVVGSDQVWSPFFLARTKTSKQFFLPSVAPERKTALAASFGLSEVPESMEAFYTEGLRSFARVSVREEAGAELVQKLSGQDATVICDPTLAVDVQTWRKMASSWEAPNKDYLLTYCLGEWDSVVRDAVERYAHAMGLDIVDLMDKDGSAFSSGPAEFLSLMDGASYLVTDSFHGTVFASLMHTPFAVTRRIDTHGRDMFSRLDTLLKSLSFENRTLDSAISLPPSESIDWERVDSQIWAERNRFMRYLEEELQRCGVI